MKNYGLRRKKLKETALYMCVKILYFIKKHITRSDSMRDYYRHAYASHFNHQLPSPKYDFSIPAGKHCRPVCLVTSDLILRENLPKLKKGLKKLLKKHYTHKFFGVTKSIDDILETIDNMDDTLTWSYSSIDVGRFDFDSFASLSPYIAYFDLHIRKINDSYLCVELHVFLTEQYTRKLQVIIDSDIAEQKTYINYAFRRNGKKSGGKKTFALCHYNEASQKCDDIYEHITTLKWKFYDLLQRFFQQNYID